MIPIVMDCDPGHDDALALALAGRTTELLAVTTVSGNVSLAKTTRNALRTLEVLGLERVPVDSGADRPLLAPIEHAEFIHGESGLDGPDLPEPSRAAGVAGVERIVRAAREREGVWLVATGPLTNVALALRAAPDLAGRLAGISVMGGGSFGNRTAAAEFNFWADPHAARIVLESGARVLLADLDLTHRWRVGRDVVARLRGNGNRASLFAADLLDYYGRRYLERGSGDAGPPLHDPCSVLALARPELVRTAPWNVRVVTDDEAGRGACVYDLREPAIRDEPNLERIVGIDAEGATDALVEALAAYG